MNIFLQYMALGYLRVIMYFSRGEGMRNEIAEQYLKNKEQEFK
jgi:hypothetical protein